MNIILLFLHNKKYHNLKIFLKRKVNFKVEESSYDEKYMFKDVSTKSF